MCFSTEDNFLSKDAQMDILHVFIWLVISKQCQMRWPFLHSKLLHNSPSRVAFFVTDHVTSLGKVKVKRHSFPYRLHGELRSAQSIQTKSMLVNRNQKKTVSSPATDTKKTQSDEHQKTKQWQRPGGALSNICIFYFRPLFPPKWVTLRLCATVAFLLMAAQEISLFVSFSPRPKQKFYHLWLEGLGACVQLFLWY